MLLYLMRHGEAVRSGPYADADRPLTASGETEIAAASRGLVHLGVQPALVLTSPARRCRRTAAIVARALGRRVQSLEALAGGRPPHSILRALAPWAAAPELFVVGHEPDLAALVAHLSGSGPLHLMLGSCCAIEIESLDGGGAVEIEWIRTAAALAVADRDDAE